MSSISVPTTSPRNQGKRSFCDEGIKLFEKRSSIFTAGDLDLMVVRSGFTRSTTKRGAMFASRRALVLYAPMTAAKPLVFAITNPIDLNHHMLQSTSTFKLEKIILNTPQDMFDPINVATAASLLQKQGSKSTLAVDKLLYISQSRQFGPRELATLCSSIAMSGLASKLPAVLIAQLESSDLTKFTPQDLSRCVYALSHFEYPMHSMLERIARDIENRGFVGRKWERNDITTVLHALAQTKGFTSPHIVHHLQAWLHTEGSNNAARLTNKHLVSLIQSVSALTPPYSTELSLSLFTAELCKRKDFKAYECSMLIHSLTKLRVKNGEVKSALLEQTEKLVGKLTLCGCSLLLSSFADPVWEKTSTTLLESICKQVCTLEWPVSALNDLALVVHSLSILEHKDVAMFDKLVKDISTGRVLRDLCNADFALVMQSFSRFRKLDEYAFKQFQRRPQEADYVAHTWRKIIAKERPALLAMAREFSRRDSREFLAEALCNILQSLASLDVTAAVDWTKLERDLRERGLRDFSTKQITIFASALPRNTNSSLVNVVAQEIQRRGLQDFTWQDLCCTARALVQFGRDGFDAPFFVQEIMQRTLTRCTGQDLSMLMWTFCFARYKHDALVNKLSEELCTRDLSRLTSTSLSSLMLSFANYYGNNSSKCMDLLCSEVCSPTRQFSPQAYCNVMWALACMDRFPVEFFNRESKHQATRSVEAAQQILQTKLAYSHHHQQEKKDSRLIGSLLGNAEEDWAVNLVKRDTFRDMPSQIQDTVTRLVRDNLAGGNGVWYQREALLENCMLVDMYIPSLRLVIEVNGKGHYMSDSMTPTGRSMFKTRMLKRCGYRVFGVNVQQFYVLSEREQQREMNDLARACLFTNTNNKSAVWEEG